MDGGHDMARSVIIATHGTMAAGIKDSLDILTGNAAGIYTICGFSEDPDPRKSIAQLMEQIGSDQEILVFTDLMGGSINQMFIPYLKTHRLHLITGCSLPLIFPLILNEEESLTKECIEDAIRTAQEEIRYVNQEAEGLLEDEDTIF